MPLLARYDICLPGPCLQARKKWFKCNIGMNGLLGFVPDIRQSGLALRDTQIEKVYDDQDEDEEGSGGRGEKH